MRPPALFLPVLKGRYEALSVRTDGHRTMPGLARGNLDSCVAL